MMDKIWIRISIVYVLLSIASWISCVFVKAGLHMIMFGSVIFVGALVMALCSMIYARRPELKNRMLSKFHFWLYQIGAPAILAALYLSLADKAGDLSLSLFSVGGAFMVMGTILFILTITQKVEQAAE